MSMMERVRGFWNGMVVGAYALPVAVTTAIYGIPRGSGAAAAFGTWAVIAILVLGGVAVALGALGCMALQLSTGIPWFLSLPGFYFLIWGLLGFILKIT